MPLHVLLPSFFTTCSSVRPSVRESRDEREEKKGKSLLSERPPNYDTFFSQKILVCDRTQPASPFVLATFQLCAYCGIRLVVTRYCVKYKSAPRKLIDELTAKY